MTYSSKKIKTTEELKKLVELRKDKFDFITTNGTFDILHRGHLYVLEKSLDFKQKLEQPSLFIVGVNSDNSVKRYKSDLRPANKESDRAYLLACLSCVDYVSIFEEDNPIEFLKIVKPKYHLKSKDGYKGLERGVVEKNGGEIVLIDDLKGYSTTNIIEKVFNMHYLERMREYD